MRQITKDATNAFFNKAGSWQRDNTMVMTTNNFSIMRLHGNLIAEFCHNNGTLYISNCGWITSTTKERLNGILDSVGVGKIYQKAGVWYWKDGQKFPENELVEVIR